MNKIILIFFFMVTIASAQPALIEKPDIPSDKILTKTEQIEVKEYLKGLIHKELMPAKNDHKDDTDRGTVYFNPEKGNIFAESELKAKNYSYHKIIIPNETTIKRVNFSQKEPHTDVISGKNLTFIECNLNNVEIDPSWTIIQSLTIHSRHRIIVEDSKIYNVYEVEKDSVFEEVDREEITTSNTD